MSASRDEKERGLRVRCLTSFFFQVCLLGYVLVGWLEAGRGSALLLAVAASLNLAIWTAVRFGPEAVLPLAHRGAPLLGVALWAGLTYLGGGVGTFFLVGFWFEILLSAVSHSVFGIACITVASAIGLVAQQAFLGFSGTVGPLVLQLTSIALVGGGTGWMRNNWVRRQERFSSELGAQQSRLEAIEEQLADAQTLADLGAQTARIGHGLKNAVHSLRGFSTLIERGLQREGGGAAGDNAALRGLREAIDQLEALAHETLQPAAVQANDDVDTLRPLPPNGKSRPRPDADLRELLDTEIRALSQVHPEVRCTLEWEGDERIAVPGTVMREVISNLLLNAAESMGGAGRVTVLVAQAERGHVLRVTDSGPGVALEMRDRIFRPGHSTKKSGHGMGLYLSRNLVESLGGSLSLADSEAGASFRIALPDSRAS